MELGTVLLSALVSGALALVTTFWGPTLRARRERKDTAEDLVARFRDVLLTSANDLQSRIYNILELGFLEAYYEPAADGGEGDGYAELNTLYVLAQHLCWHEILRRDSGYLLLRSDPQGADLDAGLDALGRELATDRVPSPFRVFWGDKRAIGEIMIVERGTGDAARPDCLGYAEFVERMEDPRFARWFGQLRTDLPEIAEAIRDHRPPERLIRLHGRLIDVLDVLDPDCLRVPEESRRRLPERLTEADRPPPPDWYAPASY